MLSMLTCLSMGCSSSSDRMADSQLDRSVEVEDANELSWDNQIALVRQGVATSIRMLQRPVTSQQLGQLKGISGLREIVLDQGVVRDENILGNFFGFQLEHLRLRNSSLTDASGIFLAQHQLDLRILNVPSAYWTIESIREISRLPKLTHLRLGGPGVDDQCVEAIAQSGSLRSLHLIGPRLTEAALGHLGQMESLQSFYLDDCELPSSAWEKLFLANPALHVHIDQAHHDRDPSKHQH